MKQFLTPLIFLLYLFSYSQDTYEYYGAVKLNDTAVISYKIAFTELNGTINGYSVTDLQGPHETRSLIKGTYNAKEKYISFNEHDIVYTKSDYAEDTFCFIHFKSERYVLGKSQSIDGTFEGKYDDTSGCLNGELLLVEMNRIRKKTAKITKKIARSKRIEDSIKAIVNPSKLLDTLNMNVLRKSELMNVFVKGKQLEMIVFDGGKEDGDRVSIWLNDEQLLEDYEIINKKRVIQIPLDDTQTRVKIKALNSGSIKPNTMSVIFKYDGRVVEALSNLSEGEVTEIAFIRR